MNKINLDSIRKKILEDSKIHIVNNGWNERLFNVTSKYSEHKVEEIKALFPNGYKDLLQYFLHQLNLDMISYSKVLNLSSMKMHMKIRAIILLRLKKYSIQKDLIKKTYLALLLPKHSRISTVSLYQTVDQMWYLSGDQSTDFNFYSKRLILAAIYVPTLFHWIYNDNIEDTSIFLDDKLKKISKIPKIKNKFKHFSKSIFNTSNILKNIQSIKQ